ncbi:hypothetical protein [Pontibacter anaerobius]|uniref:Uncharacterized protein n=1 Tax=Pontibacter anaerobius TaxID=2993940 RepID=A0ABT3RAI5_9BACT|nr:hypothetical protein [Pontibacter anaerobius]MCX2738453.1 hypothetical protein [Pontibacter anaerobius]
MKKKPLKHPPTETTKDDSSDVEKVRQGKPAPPPEPKPNKQEQQSGSKQGREAEKGHA